MTTTRRISLEAVRADGWFERVLAGVPALVRVCDALDEPLVALSLAAGLRIVSAAIDRTTGEITSLEWVRDRDGTEETHTGSPDALRAMVLSTLTAYEPLAEGLTEDDPDAARSWIGAYDLLLAPLFGLQLVALEFDDATAPAVWVVHEHGEERVPYPQLRGFLRGRVAEVLRSQHRRGVAIDLDKARVAREALDAGRFDEVIELLGGWVPALMLYLRTPEGASMEPAKRAEIARALRVLGSALHAVSRELEAEETLRLGVQWAQDGEGAAELYFALAGLLSGLGRWAESIGPLRRAKGLGVASEKVDAPLARAFIEAGRVVAAVPLIESLSEDDPAKSELDRRLRDTLGDELSRWRAVRVAPLQESVDEAAQRPTELLPPPMGEPTETLSVPTETLSEPEGQPLEPKTEAVDRSVTEQSPDVSEPPAEPEQ